MRTFTPILLFTMAVTATSAFAQSASPPLTREQFVAREQAERDAMAKKGYVWNQLYMRWDSVSWASEAKPATASREQFLANEAREAADMAAKGFKWNQLYSRYDYLGAGQPAASAAGMSRQEFLAKEASEAKAMEAQGLKWNNLYQRWDRTR